MTKFLTDALPITESTANTVLIVFFVLCAVFLFLAIIWLVSSLAEKMRRGRDGYDDECVSSTPVVTVSDDNEVIAAISAAIAVILQEEAAAKGTAYNGFRIVSFKRAGKGRAWTQK